MRRFEHSLVVVAGTAVALVSLADEQISTASDLAAVIALQAKPCGQVVRATKKSEDDYEVTCQDGNRYRVFVKDGRVVVDKIS